MSSRHHLAAIMFTDVVGYTKLMGEDETGALKFLRKNRKIHQSTIKKYHGKWLKEMGDGTLARFKTVTDAVYCAGELMAAFKDQEVQLRIGIHEGEIIEEAGDIFGDGVNIAARLEQLAKPNQILVSGSVQQNIRNRKGITYTQIEETKLKNVTDLLRIYSIEITDQTSYTENEAGNNISTRKKILASAVFAILLLAALSYIKYSNTSEQNRVLASLDGAEKSLAILPFKNLGTNEEHQYYIDGIVKRRGTARRIDNVIIVRTTAARMGEINIRTFIIRHAIAN